MKCRVLHYSYSHLTVAPAFPLRLAAAVWPAPCAARLDPPGTRPGNEQEGGILGLHQDQLRGGRHRPKEGRRQSGAIPGTQINSAAGRALAASGSEQWARPEARSRFAARLERMMTRGSPPMNDRGPAGISLDGSWCYCRDPPGQVLFSSIYCRICSSVIRYS